jgi:type II secretory pathway pseudopilin PulG
MRTKPTDNHQRNGGHRFPTGYSSLVRSSAIRRGALARGSLAFTLLELLVAVAITLVIAGLMLTVTINVLNLWRRTQGAHEQAATARQVFELFERDMQSAVHRPGSTCWLAADILDSVTALANHGWDLGPGLIKPADGGSLRPLPDPDSNGQSSIRDGRFGLSGLWLRFVATNVESGGSLPSVIAWQMVRRPVIGNPVVSNPAPIRYALYRSVVSDGETFANGYDVTAGVYGSTSNNPSGALSTAYRLPRNVTNPSHANLLASNVVDFGCWFYVRDAGGNLVRVFPENAADVTHHAVGSSMVNASRFPEVVDVLVRILNGEGVALVEAMERGQVIRPTHVANDAEWWWSEVEAKSAVFIRRIEIKGAP